MLTSSLMAGAGAAGGALLSLVPLYLPFPGSGFVLVALPVVGAAVAGGIALHGDTGSLLLGLIGAVAISGATLVGAVAGAIVVDGVTSPWVQNGPAAGGGWALGAVAGGALAAGLMSAAFGPD